MAFWHWLVVAAVFAVEVRGNAAGEVKRLAGLMGWKVGTVVADIGAGDGAYTFAAVEREQDALLAASKPSGGKAASTPVAMLLGLKSLGSNFAAVLWSEAFWRQFANRRQVASYVGLAPTPWRSGGIEREQGVSKAGNPRLRTTMIQLAWLWVRHQPQSALTQWFKALSQRGRKRAIVALARKLLVALWKYVTAGVVIEGAVMKTA